jgi:hypothetical protein
MVLGV